MRPDIAKINSVYANAVSDDRSARVATVEERKKELEKQQARKHSKLLKDNVAFASVIERLEAKLKVEEAKLLQVSEQDLKRQQGAAVGIRMALSEIHTLIANTAEPKVN